MDVSMTMNATLAGDHPEWSDDEAHSVLQEWVLHPEYPCLGARSAFRGGRATVRTYGELGSADASPDLFRHLMDFAHDADLEAGFTTFLAAFPGPLGAPTEALDEQDFERRLWEQLRSLRRLDGSAWDPAVSSDPTDDHFGFSLGGTAFFVVGLHPGASRKARRSPVPILVFNLHQQFDQLRADSRYETFRDTIRRRDLRLQGSLNPMVADHGSGSEARQYSGRAVADSWEAPFPTECPHPAGRTPADG